MIDSGENSQLLDHDEARTTDGDEDLAHDLVANVKSGVTEVDHETLSQDVEWNTDV